MIPMAELPEVEAFRKDAAGAVGKTVRAVQALDGWPTRRMSGRALDELVDRRIMGLDRYGKVLFVRFDRGPVLAMHFGSAGRLAHRRGRGEAPEDALLTLQLEDGTRLEYVNPRLGYLELADDVSGFRLEHGLGPDALAISRSEFVEELWRRPGSVRAALMDQSVVSGIGPRWSTAILSEAGIDPDADCRALTFQALGALHDVMRRVLSTGRGAEGPRTALRAELSRRSEGPIITRASGRPGESNPELLLIDMLVDEIVEDERLVDAFGTGTLSFEDVEAWLERRKAGSARFLDACEGHVAAMRRMGFGRQMRRGGKRATPSRGRRPARPGRAPERSRPGPPR